MRWVRMRPACRSAAAYRLAAALDTPSSAASWRPVTPPEVTIAPRVSALPVPNRVLSACSWPGSGEGGSSRGDAEGQLVVGGFGQGHAVVEGHCLDPQRAVTEFEVRVEGRRHLQDAGAEPDVVSEPTQHHRCPAADVEQGEVGRAGRDRRVDGRAARFDVSAVQVVDGFGEDVAGPAVLLGKGLGERRGPAAGEQVGEVLVADALGKVGGGAAGVELGQRVVGPPAAGPGPPGRRQLGGEVRQGTDPDVA